jgi:hypothetical protein
VRTGTLSVALIALLGASEVGASRAWQIVSQKTIDGIWEAVDYEGFEVCRLEVEDGKALLVITAGAGQAEYLFRSSELTVRDGNVSFVAVENAGGPTLRVVGKGKVLGEQGRLTLKMVNLTKDLTFWEDKERVFVKGSAKSRLEALIAAVVRADALASGTAKACCDANTGRASKKSEGDATK